MSTPGSFPRMLITVLWLALLGACGGGGGDGPEPAGTDPSGGWVTITSPVESGYYSTACDDVTLGGEAFQSPTWYHCCSGSASDTGVTVRWENLVSGTSGTASQSVRYCSLFGSLYVCEHTWSAGVSLVPGDNIIKVTAVDPSGVGDTETITVSRPELTWTVAGTLVSQTGTALDSYRSGVFVELRDQSGSSVLKKAYTGADGSYSFSCVRDGNYLLQPESSPFAFAFDPSWQTFSVTGSDVTGLDFSAPAFQVSGTLTAANSGYPVSDTLQLSDGSNTFIRYSGSTGSYSAVLPPGIYTVTPTGTFVTSTYSPASRIVDLSASDQAGIDFVRTYP